MANDITTRQVKAMTGGTGSPGPTMSSTCGTSDGDLSLRRGPWSSQEDEILLRLVESHGPSNWVVIAHSLGTRSAKQCRERYHQNLKPSLDHSPIRPDEAEVIERLVTQLGHRWAEIARRLPGRSDNTIKNWWNGKQNRISRHEHLKSTYTGRYQTAPPSAHHDYAGGYRGPQTPPQDGRLQPTSPSRQAQLGPVSSGYAPWYDKAPFSSSKTRYPSERDSAEISPYHTSVGHGPGPSTRPSSEARALELPPITGPRETRPRTPADLPYRQNQLPSIHTVLPPSPENGGEGEDRHQGGRNSRMALDSLISR